MNDFMNELAVADKEEQAFEAEAAAVDAALSGELETAEAETAETAEAETPETAEVETAETAEVETAETAEVETAETAEDVVATEQPVQLPEADQKIIDQMKAHAVEVETEEAEDQVAPAPVKREARIENVAAVGAGDLVVEFDVSLNTGFTKVEAGAQLLPVEKMPKGSDATVAWLKEEGLIDEEGVLTSDVDFVTPNAAAGFFVGTGASLYDEDDMDWVLTLPEGVSRKMKFPRTKVKARRGRPLK